MNAHAILIACQKPDLRIYFKELLEKHGYRIETAETEEKLLQSVRRARSYLVLLDMLFEDNKGLHVLARCKEVRPEQRIVMFSCSSEASDIVQAIKLGAQDFIDKPLEPSRVQEILVRVLGPPTNGNIRTPLFSSESDELTEELDQDFVFLAASHAMRQIRAQAALVAKVDLPVLILGESGVGKEVVARLMHKLSTRAGNPFLKINCAALPSELLESELFGYEAGAFTGATRFKPGKFELANKGTVLLDEIGEMSPWLQAKILHVLQDGYYSRLGGKRDVRVDVRILAATNIDVEKAIVEKRFRQDLYYRLNAFTVNIPPLRERREEIPHLLHHFVRDQARKLGRPPLAVSERLLQACIGYHWPGNLRELANVVKRYLVLEDENVILHDLKPGASEFSAKGCETRAAAWPVAATRSDPLDPKESEEIQRALETAQWDQQIAAGELRIGRKTLASKMKQYGLHPPQPHNGWLRYG